MANKYTFVWGKSIKNSKEKIKNQLDEPWKYAQSLAAEELKDTALISFEKINPEKVKTIVRINVALEDKK